MCDLSHLAGQGRRQLENGWFALRVGSERPRFRCGAGACAAAPASSSAGFLTNRTDK